MALDAIKGIKTVQDIAAETGHPTQVTQLKSQVLEGASEVFDQGLGRKVEQDTERLVRKIGQLLVEVDGLSKRHAPPKLWCRPIT